jgi:hypothetical protein
MNEIETNSNNNNKKYKESTKQETGSLKKNKQD